MRVTTTQDTIAIKSGNTTIQTIKCGLGEHYFNKRVEQISERIDAQNAEQSNNPDTDYITPEQLYNAIDYHLQINKPSVVTVYDTEGDTNFRPPYNVTEIINSLLADEIGNISTTGGLNVTFTEEYLGSLIHEYSGNDLTIEFIKSLKPVDVKKQLQQLSMDALISLHNYDNQCGDNIYIDDNGNYYYRDINSGKRIEFDTLEESPIDIDALTEWLERDTATATLYGLVV